MKALLIIVFLFQIVLSLVLLSVSDALIIELTESRVTFLICALGASYLIGILLLGFFTLKERSR